MASPKRNALGRGLDSLISMDDIQTSGSSAINEISLSQITPNPDQPRTWFDEESLEELASASSSPSHCAKQVPTNIKSFPASADSAQRGLQGCRLCRPTYARQTTAKSPKWR